MEQKQVNQFRDMILQEWSEIRQHYLYFHKSRAKHGKEMAMRLAHLWCELEPMVKNTAFEKEFMAYESKIDLYLRSPAEMVFKEEIFDIYRILRKTLHNLGITKIEQLD